MVRTYLDLYVRQWTFARFFAIQDFSAWVYLFIHLWSIVFGSPAVTPTTTEERGRKPVSLSHRFNRISTEDGGTSTCDMYTRDVEVGTFLMCEKRQQHQQYLSNSSPSCGDDQNIILRSMIHMYVQEKIPCTCCHRHTHIHTNIVSAHII